VTRAWLAAGALLLLSAWEIVTLLRVHADAPTDPEWVAAAAAVRAQFAPGDLIVFAPAWMDPVGRKHLGDLMTFHDAARMDAARYARVWEISARGASAPDATGPVALDESFGALRVRRHDRVAARVTWDLRPRAHLLEVDYAPRECVDLHAPGRLDAGAVPLGSTLAVYAGLSDFRSRRDNRAWAIVRVLIDDAEVARTSIGSESGWVPLPAIATKPGPHHVVLESSVDPSKPGTPAVLSVCVAAEARE
jgi:hypothetical protein